MDRISNIYFFYFSYVFNHAGRGSKLLLGPYVLLLLDFFYALL
jgi:hypothetical protein